MVLAFAPRNAHRGPARRECYSVGMTLFDQRTSGPRRGDRLAAAREKTP